VVDVHVDRLGRGYVAGLRRWGKCMLPALLLIIPCAHLSISSDSRHSLLSSTCLPHALCTCVRTCLVRVLLLALCLAGSFLEASKLVRDGDEPCRNSRVACLRVCMSCVCDCPHHVNKSQFLTIIQTLLPRLASRSRTTCRRHAHDGSLHAA